MVTYCLVSFLFSPSVTPSVSPFQADHPPSARAPAEPAEARQLLLLLSGELSGELPGYLLATCWLLLVYLLARRGNSVLPQLLSSNRN